jgi:secreted trypsin-like serine protease
LIKKNQGAIMSIIKIIAMCLAVFACHEPTKHQMKIIGGKPVSEPVPFFVQLTDSANAQSGFCGGSLIAPRIVVTAAHCIQSPQDRDLHVVMGLADGENVHLNRPVKVLGMIVHPEFDHQARKSDIAVLYLDQYDPRQFDGPVAPVEFARELEDPIESYKTSRIFGLGHMSSHGILKDRLVRAVDVPLISVSQCKESYDSVDETQICAVDAVNGGVDSCNGDSGGPLLIKSKNEKWILAGIVSYGDHCAQKNKPGIYTNIASFSDFIDQSIKQLEQPEEKPIDEALRLIKTRCYSKFGHMTFVSKAPSAYRETAYSMNLNKITLSAATDEERGQIVDECIVEGPKGPIRAKWIKTESNNLASVSKVVLDIKAGAAHFSSRPQVLRYKEDQISCSTSEGDVVLSDMRNQTFVSFRDVNYNVGPMAEPPKDGQATWGCSLDDSSVEVYKVRDGANEYLAARIHHRSVGTVTVKLLRADREVQIFAGINWETQGKGILMISNNEIDQDLFTWSLKCSGEYSLKLSNGQALNSVQGLVIVDNSVFEDGTIRAGKSLSLEITGQGGSPVDSCIWNNVWPVEFWGPLK